MIEKQLKFSITRQQIPAFTAALKKAGAILQRPRVREFNTVYDDPVGSVQVQDARLCLQSGTNYSISYERTISRRGVRQDLVLATRIGSIVQMKKILQRIGFRQVSHYVSYRTTWQVGAAAISFYEFTFGTFIELTGEVQSIVRYAERLGFDPAASVMESYDDLYRGFIAGEKLTVDSE